ncbi:MAG: MBOAT family protein [Bacteroidales bacterium]|nr:MAG: MBOAT family protein [Bacteroidales bacterium]
MINIKDIFNYSEENPLLFTRIYFWIFFTILLLLYSIIYRRKALRNVYLFLMSLFFYFKSGGYFFSLLIISTVVDYTVGLLIHQSKSTPVRKLYVALSLLVNLGMLAYFKYTYFLTDVFNQVFNGQVETVNILARWSNNYLGSHFDISRIILPVGISFFTFQTISYTLDVYRGKVEPVRNILDFGFYVSFFPQLVAGPIVRAADFIPQLYREFELSVREMGHAFFLILSGLVKKMLISDYISINFVDRVFSDPLAYTGFENLMGVYGYSLQIYCDFSGYTDIAIGVGLLLGFRLPVNFNSPYKAGNISNFWKRWHISLSSWLRDYLYIPLGGSRKGRIRTGVNLLITMLLGGLWHGASLRFVIWGGLHGVGLVFHKLWLRFFPVKRKPSRLRKFLTVFLTFHFVTLLWIVFRADNLSIARNMVEQILYHFSPDLIPQMIWSYKLVFSIITAGFIIHWLPSSFKDKYRGFFIRIPLYVKIIIFIVVIIIIYQAKSSVIQPFIYFQF